MTWTCDVAGVKCRSTSFCGSVVGGVKVHVAVVYMSRGMCQDGGSCQSAESWAGSPASRACVTKVLMVFGTFMHGLDSFRELVAL
jgi:hypothetical protein